MAFLKSFATAGLIALSGATMAQAETVLKFATVVPEKTIWGEQVHRLADAIARESEGRIKVEPYFNSQLGTENDTLAQLARGRIEMGVFTLSAGADNGNLRVRIVIQVVDMHKHIFGAGQVAQVAGQFHVLFQAAPGKRHFAVVLLRQVHNFLQTGQHG